MIRILVCGGRDYGKSVGEEQYLRYTLFAIRDRIENQGNKIQCIIHGAARGADILAGEWAKANGIEAIEEPAKWDDLDHPLAVIRTNKWGKLYNINAGPIRNQLMIDEHKPTHCVAFPGGNGTKDMVNRCREAGIPVLEIKPL